MTECEVGKMSQKLMGILQASEYRPVIYSKEKVTADKMDWLFEYDGFDEVFSCIVDAVSEENIISEELLLRYEDLRQTQPAELLSSADVLEVMGSLAKLSMQNSNQEDTCLYPERILTSSGSTELAKKEFSLLQQQAEILRNQVRYFQGQVQLERLSVVQKEELLKTELTDSRRIDEQIASAACELDETANKLLSEVCQLGAFYAAEQSATDLGACGIMGTLPFQDIYRMEEDFAAKFTAYTRKQLGHKGVIHLTANGAPVDKPSGRLSSQSNIGGPLSSTSIVSNGLDHIRNEELAACFKALTPARPSNPKLVSSNNQCISFLRPGRLVSAKFSSSRLSANPENNGDVRLSVDEMTVILQEIYAHYGLALMERTRSVVERDRLLGCVNFLEQFSASIERGELSNIIPNLEINLTRCDRKYLDLKMKFDSSLLSGSSSIASSLDRLVSLSVESILDCGLDLELKRKEYVLDKREKVIGYLKAICARGLSVRLLLENELNSVTETVRLGESVVENLKTCDDARLARKTFFGKAHFSLKQLPKYAVDSVNVFISAFHNLLIKFPFSEDVQLSCCHEGKSVDVLTLAHVAEHIQNYIENLKSTEKSVSIVESAILQQTVKLTSLINQMRGVLSNDGLASSPISLLSNLANRVNRETDVLEAQLTGEIRNVDELKRQLADPLVREERLFFTKFFGDSGNESGMVNQVISDLQEKLSF